MTYAFYASILGAIARNAAFFGQGSPDQPILFDNVRCKGIEYRLLNCPHLGIDNHNCNHQRDAGVSCQEGMVAIRLNSKHSFVWHHLSRLQTARRSLN